MFRTHSSDGNATLISVTCGGLKSIASPMGMLDAGRVLARGIPDGRLGERIARVPRWTRGVPAPN